MCGIAGVIGGSFSKGAADKRVRGILAAMSRRGPDGNGVWSSDGIALGHVRLSIIDLTEAAGQPMVDEEAGIALAFNGEIYNYVELRRELSKLGYSFRTQSDTEVMLKAYLEWGLSAFSRFVGMWAVALFEIPTRRLILSRDRFGIKPLYFMRKGDELVFASTIEGVRSASDCKLELNRRTVRRYLLDGTVDSGCETFFDDITRFPPGCHAVIEYDAGDTSMRYERYWDVGSFLGETENPPMSFNEARSVFREKLEDSVRIHTRSDVDVASCLSGGLDSSAIVSVLASIPEGTGIRNVFSAVFPGERFDEGGYSTTVAKRYDLKQFRVMATRQSFLADIDSVIHAQEEPFGSTGVYVQWKVFEEMRNQGVKVALDGQGADEYLGGYLSFMFPYALDCLMHLHPVRAALALHSYFQGNSFRHYVTQNFPGLLSRLFGVKANLLRSPFSRYLAEPVQVSEAWRQNVTTQEFAELQGFGLKKALARYLTQYSLPSLLRYEDRNSMWFSIESRVPFLDHRLVEFALSMPAEYLVNGRWTKRILRESVRGIVPDEIVKRRDKIGFGNPAGEFMEALIGTQAFRELLDDPIAKNFLDVPKVTRLVAEREQSGIDITYLFRVYTFLAWHRSLRGW